MDFGRRHTARGGLGITIGQLGAGERLPPGRYRFAVDSADLAVSRTGKDVVRIMLCVVCGEYQGRTVPQTYSIEYPERLHRLLRATGGWGELADDPDRELTASDLVGREFEGEVVLEEGDNHRQWLAVYPVEAAE